MTKEFRLIGGFIGILLCHFVAGSALDAQTSSEIRRTLAKEEIFGGLSLPAQSVTISSSAGEPLEAIIPSITTWGTALLPANSRILYFPFQTMILVPRSSSGLTDWQTAQPGVLALREDESLDFNYDVHQCYDYPPWLAINGAVYTTNMYDPPHPLPSLSLKLLPISSTSAGGIGILSASFHSNDFDLPKGTIIVADDRNENAIGFYASSPMRFGLATLPPYSFLWMRYLSFSEVYTHQSTTLNGLSVGGRNLFELDARGSLALGTLNQAQEVLPEFIVPSGSRIGLSASRPFRVDLSGTTTYHGISIPGLRTICFLPDGTANLLLKSDSQVGGYTFPAASTLVVNSTASHVDYAFLSAPMKIGGFLMQADTNRNKLVFYNNDKLRAGTLSKAAVISGLPIDGFVTLDENGNLQLGTLVSDQRIGGVPCEGNRTVMLNSAGNVVSCTIAANYDIGSSHFHRGDFFGGIYQQSDKVLVLPRNCKPNMECLPHAMGMIHDQLFGLVRDGLLKNSSKFPFGNIGRIETTNFTWDTASDHIDIHQNIYVENMFTNPPFADCDGHLSIEMTIRWTVTSGFMRQYVTAWPASIGGSLDHGFCPGTQAIEAAASVASSLFSHVRDLMDGYKQSAANAIQTGVQKSTIREEIAEQALDQFRTVAQAMEADGKVLPDSLKIGSLFIDDQGLELSYTYQVEEK